MKKHDEICSTGTGYREIQNYVNERTVNYIVKYLTKVDEKHKAYKSIVLTSHIVTGKQIGRAHV